MESRTARKREGRFGALRQIAPDVTCLMLPIVNVFFVGTPGGGDRSWVLVDAGLPGSARRIAAVAEQWLGSHGCIRSVRLISAPVSAPCQ